MVSDSLQGCVRSEGRVVAVDAKLLEILVCPARDCRGRMQLRDAELVCQRCGRRYRVEAQFPVLIPEEATPPTNS